MRSSQAELLSDRTMMATAEALRNELVEGLLTRGPSPRPPLPPRGAAVLDSEAATGRKTKSVEASREETSGAIQGIAGFGQWPSYSTEDPGSPAGANASASLPGSGWSEVAADAEMQEDDITRRIADVMLQGLAEASTASPVFKFRPPQPRSRPTTEVSAIESESASASQSLVSELMLCFEDALQDLPLLSGGLESRR